MTEAGRMGMTWRRKDRARESLPPSLTNKSHSSGCLGIDKMQYWAPQRLCTRDFTRPFITVPILLMFI